MNNINEPVLVLGSTTDQDAWVDAMDAGVPQDYTAMVRLLTSTVVVGAADRSPTTTC